MSQAKRFRALHSAGTFVLPNPWDVGSARILVALGFEALATTGAGFAASLGRSDRAVSRDELLAHVEAIVGAVDVPVSVDADNGYADDPAGVADTVTELAAVGAAGCSIEDADLDDIARVVEAVAAPVNVLALPNGPSVPQLADVGVRRVSVGAALAGAAYSALVRGAQELLESGTSSYVVQGRSQPHPFSLF